MFMIFSVSNAEDYHGPSGLAMTDRRGFPERLVEKTKPILKWANWLKVLCEMRL
jgi:hypothetical protein